VVEAVAVDTLLSVLTEQRQVQTVALAALAEQAVAAVVVVERVPMETQAALAALAEQVVVLFTTKENEE
jgi:hypothetical protein